jgi:spore germination protein KC
MSTIRERIQKALLLLLCVLMLSGCWSRRELNELMIVLGIGLDWEDGEFLVSFQVVNPSEISTMPKGGERPPMTLYQSKGKTLFEAARSLTAEAPRKVYLGHLQIYVIGEELARMGISNFIDNSLRDNELRMDSNLIIAKGMKAQDLLKLFTPLERLPTQNMLHSLQTSEKSWAPTVSVNLDDLLNKLSTHGDELAVTGIQLVGTKKKATSKQNVESYMPSTRFRYTGIAVFKTDKLVGWLNEQESKGFTDISGKLKSTSIEVPCGKNSYTGIEVTSSNTKIKMEIKNGRPEAHIQIRTEANIVDRMCKDIDLENPATIQELNEEIKVIIQNNAEASIKKAQKLKSDIFGFGSTLGMQHPQFWQPIMKEWNEEWFPVLKVQYQIETHIRKLGTTSNTTMY